MRTDAERFDHHCHHSLRTEARTQVRQAGRQSKRAETRDAHAWEDIIRKGEVQLLKLLSLAPYPIVIIVSTLRASNSKP